MLTPAALAAAKPVVFLGGLVLFLALERLRPFFTYTSSQTAGSKVRHGARNLMLAVFNAGLSALVLPLLGKLLRGFDLGHIGLLSFAVAPLSVWHWIFAILLFDCWMYWWHRVLHRSQWLWRFHRVHHSDAAMDVTTALRFHFGEVLLSHVVRTPVILLIGMTLSDVVFYELLMLGIVAFHHSNIQVGKLDPLLRVVIITPDWHRMHHSEERVETDSNYGVLFSFWDRLFGSHRMRPEMHNLILGLGELSDPDQQSVWRLLKLPFARGVSRS